jgi:uncharacterized protein
MTRIGVISDTHGRLRPEVFDRFRDVEFIVHAGDIGPPGILDDLGALAPVIAVWGNTDDFAVRHLVPEIATQQVAGLALVVLHGHQFGSPTPAALLDAHPAADLIVYGHTHRPLVERHGRTLVLNPGSAGAARFGLAPSLALVTVSDDRVDARIIDLD